MNDHGKSDSRVVPAKLANKTGQPVAELVEERRLAEGNTGQQNAPRTQGRDDGASSALERVRRVARKDKEARFTALLHHVDLARLWAAYAAISPKAAPGVDRVTWDAYGRDLRVNLEDLLRRVRSGAYRASPSRRVYIPKPDGRLRPLGIATLEDKIVQRAVAEVLNAVYEEDFLGFSYGFRPGRSPHDALDALAVGIEKRKVNWILDADIRGVYDAIDHGWMRRFVEHRIADKRVLRLIQKWLSAGVIEDGAWSASEEGAPQGTGPRPARDVLVPRLHAHVREDAGRTVRAAAQDDRKADGGQAARGERLAHATTSLACRRAGAMAGQRSARARRLLRGSRQHPCRVGIPETGHAALGPGAAAPEPAPPPDLGKDGPTRGTVDPSRPHHASLAERPIRRPHPR